MKKVELAEGRFNEVAEGRPGPVWPACNSLELDARPCRRLIQPGPTTCCRFLHAFNQDELD